MFIDKFVNIFHVPFTEIAVTFSLFLFCCSSINKIVTSSSWGGQDKLLLPSLSNEALQNAKEKADDAAIKVFAKNLKQLLLGSPLGERRVLAIDPGFRTGCKVVCLDEKGDLKYNETIYPHPPKNDRKGAKRAALDSFQENNDDKAFLETTRKEKSFHLWAKQ